MFLPSHALPTPDHLIRPGLGISNAHLGQTPRQIERRFPKNARGDGAIEGAPSFFKGHARIDLSGTKIGGATTVISTTSRSLHLVRNLRPGSPLSAFRKAFPGARESREGLWDDVRRGLAWTAENGRVVSVLVHQPSRPLFPGTWVYQGSLRL